MSQRFTEMRSGSTRIILFDSDASNPYPLELAALLRRSGVKTSLAIPADISDPPYPLRPRFGASGVGIWRELRSLGRLVCDRQPILVVWARTYQKILFGALAAIFGRRIIAIVHNPVASRWPQGFRATIESFYLSRAQPVTHSIDLQNSLQEFTGFASKVAPHPLYEEWVRRWVTRDSAPHGGSARFLLLGRLAPEKFIGIHELVDALSVSGRAIDLKLLVRPKIDVCSGSDLLNVINLSADEWISDQDLGDALGWADVLLAPYPGMTESGTVQLALSAGVDVVGFDVGAMGVSLRDDALVPVGDYPALVAAAQRVFDIGMPTCRWSLGERSEEQRRSWLAVIAEDDRSGGSDDPSFRAEDEGGFA